MALLRDPQRFQRHHLPQQVTPSSAVASAVLSPLTHTLSLSFSVPAWLVSFLFSSFVVYMDLVKQLVPGGLSPFALGAVCSNLAWLTIWPLDVVKSQQQSGNYAGKSYLRLVADVASSGALFRGTWERRCILAPFFPPHATPLSSAVQGWCRACCGPPSPTASPWSRTNAPRRSSPRNGRPWPTPRGGDPPPPPLLVSRDSLYPPCMSSI